MDIDLPGFKKDEVNVELKNGYLTISAAKGLDKDEKDRRGHATSARSGTVDSVPGASTWATSAPRMSPPPSRTASCA